MPCIHAPRVAPDQRRPPRMGGQLIVGASEASDSLDT